MSNERPLGSRPYALSTYGQAVLTLHERHSRLLLAARSPSKEAHPIANSMSSILCPLPPQWRQSITFDNGTEFAQHHQLHALGFQTFFCDTYSPWQKGGIENAIGRLRRTLPRKTDLGTLSDERFTQLVQAYNNTPRKCLGYNTPAEPFWIPAFAGMTHSRLRGNDELGGDSTGTTHCRTKDLRPWAGFMEISPY